MGPKTPLLRHIFDMGLLTVHRHISKFSNFSEHSHVGCRWKYNLMLIQNHNRKWGLKWISEPPDLFLTIMLIIRIGLTESKYE